MPIPSSRYNLSGFILVLLGVVVVLMATSATNFTQPNLPANSPPPAGNGPHEAEPATPNPLTGLDGSRKKAGATDTAQPLLEPERNSGDEPGADPEDQQPASVGRKSAPVGQKSVSVFEGNLLPNELGKVMILLYHGIGDEDRGWTRSAASFRRDLETLYEEGYRPVGLNEYLSGEMDLPAGFTPVVLTFDDSSRSQFNYLLTDGEPVIDPSSAIGILLGFHEKHPDFPLKATFFINFPSPFGQPAFSERKLKELVELGLELGNHTWNHTHLGRVPAQEAAKAIARVIAEIDRILPGYSASTIALPYGALPSPSSVAEEGEWEGIRYQNRAVLLVGAEPAPSPFSTGFKPLRLPRIQAVESELTRWLGHFRAKPDERYASDGDPGVLTVPGNYVRYLAPNVGQGRSLVVLSDSPSN